MIILGDFSEKPHGGLFRESRGMKLLEVTKTNRGSSYFWSPYVGPYLRTTHENSRDDPRASRRRCCSLCNRVLGLAIFSTTICIINYVQHNSMHALFNGRIRLILIYSEFIYISARETQELLTVPRNRFFFCRSSCSSSSSSSFRHFLLLENSFVSISFPVL